MGRTRGLDQSYRARGDRLLEVSMPTVSREIQRLVWLLGIAQVLAFILYGVQNLFNTFLGTTHCSEKLVTNKTAPVRMS